MFVFLIKTGTACGADFYSSSLDKADSPGDPSDVGSEPPSTPSSERRRSERVRREKPDYYDALEFETKRPRSDQRDKPYTVAGGGQLQRSSKKYKSPRALRGSQEDGQEGPLPRGRPRKWKKGRDDLDDDDYSDKRIKKKRKQPHLIIHHNKLNNEPKEDTLKMDRDNDPEEELSTAMDELAPEKSLQCQVSLAEINRKLGVVMCQPVL